MTLAEAKSRVIVPLPTCIFLLVESQEILASVVEDDVDKDRVGVLKTGLVKVLFVRVSEPARVLKVPVVGSVTFVAPVVVSVSEFAPDVTKFPASVIVLEPLLTPVPPYVEPITDPFHVPVVIVPRVVKLEEVTPDANVDPVSVPAAAVTVAEDPNDTEVPLIVIDELANEEFGIETSRALGSVPLVIFEASVVSTVAEEAKPLILLTDIAADALISAFTIVPSAIIVLVTTPESAVVTILP